MNAQSGHSDNFEYFDCIEDIDDAARLNGTSDKHPKSNPLILWCFSSIHWKILLVLSLAASASIAFIPSLRSQDSDIYANKNDDYEWDTTPFRYNFVVQSPYGSSSHPYSAMYLPMLTTHRLGDVSGNITSIIICFHGYTRNADDYFRTAVDALNGSISAMIIVPLFSQDPMKGDDWGGNTPPSSMSLYWNTSNWMKGIATSSFTPPSYPPPPLPLPPVLTSITAGGNASPKPSRYISSFDTIDLLIAHLSNSSLFPSLQIITLAGYSAGSQFVSHYSWASDVGSPPSIVRFLLSASSSYLYLSPHRPHTSCMDMNNYSTALHCTGFDLPESIPSCPEYDDWKFGLSSLPLSYLYFEKYASDEEALSLRTDRLRVKDVHYVLGDEDICNCNLEGYANDATICFPHLQGGGSDDGESDSPLSAPPMWGLTEPLCSPSEHGGEGCCDTFPDSIHNLLAVGCPAMLQGLNRYQRGLLYIAHLKHFWAEYNFTPPLEIVPGMRHDRREFFSSNTFRRLAYLGGDDGARL